MIPDPRQNFELFLFPFQTDQYEKLWPSDFVELILGPGLSIVELHEWHKSSDAKFDVEEHFFPILEVSIDTGIGIEASVDLDELLLSVDLDELLLFIVGPGLSSTSPDKSKHQTKKEAGEGTDLHRYFTKILRHNLDAFNLTHCFFPLPSELTIV